VTISPIAIASTHGWSVPVASPLQLVVQSGVAVVHFAGASPIRRDRLEFALSTQYDSNQTLLVTPTMSIAAVQTASGDAGSLVAVDTFSWRAQLVSAGRAQIVLQADIAATPTTAGLVRVAFQLSVLGVRFGAAAREAPETETESLDFELASVIE
jgi:hypothetical protein